MHFSNYKRLFFAHLPTPLELLTNLSKQLGETNIWIKRDDCTGLAGGGNKTRKLEFVMADALHKKADVIITQGATQSNHARQTAAISAKLGLDCYILLENRTQSKEHNHNYNGNVLLDCLFGAKVIRYANNTDMEQEMELLAAKLIKQGKYKNPYVIPGGAANSIGALGYANAALELVSQANAMDLKIDHIITATGSAGTQAGLVAGLIAINANIPVLGIGVRLAKKPQESKVYEHTKDVAKLLKLKVEIPFDAITANCDYIGDGYGITTKDSLAAIKLLAQTEGILLDPVYSGKAMAGLIDLLKKDYFAGCKNIVFLHTGGSQAISGYLQHF